MGKEEKRLIGFFVLLPIGLLIGLWGIFAVGIPIEYSEGDRTGVPFKLSHKGVIWKTWEGQLQLAGATAGEGGVVVPNLWTFSVEDVALAEEIEQAAANGERVTLHYKQFWIMAFRQGSSGSLVVKITKTASSPQNKATEKGD